MPSHRHPARHRALAGLLGLVLTWTGAALPLAATAVEAPHNILIVLRDGSVVRGVLLHRMPTAYLVQAGGVDRVVPFDQVTDLQDLGEAVDSTPQPLPQPQPQVQPQPVPVYVAPPPTYVAPTPPVAQPAGTMDNEPKPEVVGTGMIVGGWVTFGVGTAAMLTFAAMSGVESVCATTSSYPYSPTQTANNCADSQSKADSYLAVAYGMGIVATAGLALAIVGHVRKGISKGKLRTWEEQRGIHESGGWPQANTVYADLHLRDATPGTTTVVPFATRDGALGMALGGTF